MAVRGSKYSTGLVDDCEAQPATDARSKTTGTERARIALSIPGREPELIIEFQLLGILAAMIMRIGPISAKTLSLLVVLAICATIPQVSRTEDIAVADRIVVHKAEHKLYLYSGSHLLGEYRVALGLSPVGQKERERDFRTPEGRYFLARRNSRSEFFLALQVSYPNKEDEQRAHKNGWSPGGAIMIHGYPNAPKHPSAYYESNDWTDGCIALSNSDMVEVWMRTQDNIPIDIYP
jgi:murein L,D-transpeptidase YafK